MLVTVDANLVPIYARGYAGVGLVRRPVVGWRKAGTRALPRPMDERSMVLGESGGAEIEDKQRVKSKPADQKSDRKTTREKKGK